MCFCFLSLILPFCFLKLSVIQLYISEDVLVHPHNGFPVWRTTQLQQFCSEVLSLLVTRTLCLSDGLLGRTTGILCRSMVKGAEGFQRTVSILFVWAWCTTLCLVWNGFGYIEYFKKTIWYLDICNPFLINRFTAHQNYTQHKYILYHRENGLTFLTE